MRIVDAVNWKALQGQEGAKAGYRDGPESEWPAEAWDAFAHDPVLNITVLANPEWEAFDFEAGNAGVEQVAEACAVREHHGQWSVVYCNGSNHQAATNALAVKGLRFRPATDWPAPGVYLACADPTGAEHMAVAWAPVQPVWVQWAWHGDYDEGSTWGEFPKRVLTPPPPPKGDNIVSIAVPMLKNGDNGAAVIAAQKLLGGLVNDGIFGSLTDQAVRRFQAAHGLGVDGIVGPHTWGAQLGHPQ